MSVASFQEVLDFWFSPTQSARWYDKEEAFDAEIRRRFLATYEAALAGALDDWRRAPQSLLALVIVLDQFPRNMFRGRARAFAADAQALGLTRDGVERGFDRALSQEQRDFFCMPLMHSEALGDHDLLAGLGYADNPYALEHRQIIARFGRFPHRNRVLGREDTAAEADYLAGPHPAF